MSKQTQKILFFIEWNSDLIKSDKKLFSSLIKFGFYRMIHHRRKKKE